MKECNNNNNNLKSLVSKLNPTALILFPTTQPASTCRERQRDGREVATPRQVITGMMHTMPSVVMVMHVTVTDLRPTMGSLLLSIVQPTVAAAPLTRSFLHSVELALLILPSHLSCCLCASSSIMENLIDWEWHVNIPACGQP